MAGWHHWLDGRESQWTPGVGVVQGSLACCDSWGRKESDTTERLIWSDLIWNNNSYSYKNSSYLGFQKAVPCTLISADELISNPIGEKHRHRSNQKRHSTRPYSRSGRPSVFPSVTKWISPRPVFPVSIPVPDNHWTLNYSNTPPLHILYHQYFQIYGFFSLNIHICWHIIHLKTIIIKASLQTTYFSSSFLISPFPFIINWF